MQCLHAQPPSEEGGGKEGGLRGEVVGEGAAGEGGGKPVEYMLEFTLPSIIIAYSAKFSRC